MADPGMFGLSGLFPAIEAAAAAAGGNIISGRRKGGIDLSLASINIRRDNSALIASWSANNRIMK